LEPIGQLEREIVRLKAAAYDRGRSSEPGGSVGSEVDAAGD